MGFLTGFFALFFYVAVIIFVAGVGFKISQYAKTPAPLKVPTMPAPLTRQGVALRLFTEVVFFKSLFRANKWIWILGWMFHFALLLVLLRHLRYFVDLSSPIWFWVTLIQPFGKYAAFAMLAGLVGLLVRRFTVERIRYISLPSDYLMLALLLLIGISGSMMTFVAHTDIVQLKDFIGGVMRFDFSKQMPNDFVLMVHLSLVFILMIIFPFSKLLHAPGIFFSPSRNQVDNSREKRHLAPWAAKLEEAE